MEKPNKCRELFLDGVTDVYLYSVEDSSLPIPYSVGQLLRMNDCEFGNLVLHLAASGEEYVIVEDITVKTTPERRGYDTVYTFDISADVMDGGENLHEVYKGLVGKDYYVVLRKNDGTFHLCYTLPNTFVFKSPVNVSRDSEQRSVSITLKSLSEFIPITLK